MNLRTVLAVGGSILLVSVADTALAKNVAKEDICHFDSDMALFHVINVSGNAVASHFKNHGDVYPGTYYADSDGDGAGSASGGTNRCPNPGFVGNNDDAFPNDPTETTDTDGDGVGDNSDQFPNDPNETTDTDGDGIGDNGDACPTEAGLPENDGCPVVTPSLGANMVTGNVSPGSNANKLSAILGDFIHGYSITNYNSGFGFESVSVAGADLNGDGLTDIVAVGESGQVRVAFAPNIYTFSHAGTITPASPFEGVSAGFPILVDVNNDGNLDIVAKSYRALAVFLGNGDGTFGPETKFVTAFEPRSVAAGDINGDGHIDLAAAGESGSGSIGVHYGDGTGTFTTTFVGSGTNPSGRIQLVDIDNDDDIDIVTGSWASEYRIYTNNGGGSFATGPIVGTGLGFVLLAADLDGDDWIDLVTSKSGGTSIQVRLNDGAGGFGPGTTYGVGTTPTLARLGDFDQDGKADLVVVNFHGGNISLLLGNGDGTYSTATNIGPLPVGPNSIVVGTFE